MHCRRTPKDHFMRTSRQEARQELTLGSALSDPLIRTLMAADKVDPAKLQSMLTRIARQVMPRVTPGVSPAIEAGCGCPA
jgi:hypothetical protein